MSSPSLYTLPVELIYHLFEYLDIPTILFSFRYVCKRFETIVNLFNRYKLDMRLISKYDFDHICHLISPEKILSIILINDNNTPYQIRTFLSHFSFDQFSQLQLLDLIRIEEKNLFSILIYMSKCSLKSLTINCSSWDTFSYTIRVLLSSIISKSNLEKLDLNISYRNIDMISWSPLPITLKYLRLERCTFQEYCMIIRHTINLQKLTLTECLMYNSDETMYQPSDVIYPLKLTSLSFGTCFMHMKELLIFLSCIPILNHMKLIIWTDSTDSSFQRPFWIEKHQWFVICDYIKTSSVIRLYSLPICNPVFTYYTGSKTISYSTLKTIDNRIQLIHQVYEINLDLNEIQNNPIFCKVTRLSLNLDGRCSYTSLRLLRTIINLSSLVCLSMEILMHNFPPNLLFINSISSLLKETLDIHTLKITYVHIEEPFINSEILCSIIPRSVQHLQISIKTLNQMKTILEQLNQLLSVKFYYQIIMTILKNGLN